MFLPLQVLPVLPHSTYGPAAATIDKGTAPLSCLVLVGRYNGNNLSVWSLVVFSCLGSGPGHYLTLGTIPYP
jgi:hypothetical protein